ncbi:MAG: ParB/RepB/Spo0J family partition protein [Oscillospiraceae bacterium]|nr:ParB/RepB/Spo0J family partition protein [Oscillospiraceae bacterium]
MTCQKLKTYMETGRVVFLPARSIRPNPSQPRKLFREEQLTALTESIKIHGILQPLTVRRTGAYYELVAGERRLRAGLAAGLTELPCIVLQMTDREAAMAAMVENLQRQDLDYWEQAQGISLLMEEFLFSQEQAAEQLGMSQSTLANKLRLLRHSPPVQQRLRETGLTERHARALLRISCEEEKLQIIELCIRQDWTVARLEQYIDSLQRPEKNHSRQGNIGRFLERLGKSLSRFQKEGIPAVSERKETESQIVFTITIPK